MVDDVDASETAHAAPAEDPLGPLGRWIGTWRGRGRGDFPTIEAFEYLEEVTFAPTGKPVLSYVQRTRSVDGAAMHAESGFLRRTGPVDADTGMVPVEWVIAQPTGLAETSSGEVRDDVVMTTSRVHRTPTAVEVPAVRRRYAIVDDVLSYDLWMATADVPDLTHHLRAELHRD